jgi:hypothetical protein
VRARARRSEAGPTSGEVFLLIPRALPAAHFWHFTNGSPPPARSRQHGGHSHPRQSTCVDSVAEARRGAAGRGAGPVVEGALAALGVKHAEVDDLAPQVVQRLQHSVRLPGAPLPPRSKRLDNSNYFPL